jgi:hypothetical protein
MKDTVIKNRYNNPQQSRDAMKYIAIYRKSLRNNNNLSSSRSKIVLTDYNSHNKSARETVELGIHKIDKSVESILMTSPIELPQISKNTAREMNSKV